MATQKITTGITGLAVARHPRKTLQVLYNRILMVLQKMPLEAMYRVHTTSIINDRLAIVNSEPDAQLLEKKLNAGQLEEVILQAERELQLSSKMLQWRPWEPLINQPPKDQWRWPAI